MFLFLGAREKGYDRIDGYKNGLAKVYKGKCVGYINTQGEEVILMRKAKRRCA